jgi:hypothetical protein
MFRAGRDGTRGLSSHWQKVTDGILPQLVHRWRCRQDDAVAALEMDRNHFNPARFGQRYILVRTRHRAKLYLCCADPL